MDLKILSEANEQTQAQRLRIHHAGTNLRSVDQEKTPPSFEVRSVSGKIEPHGADTKWKTTWRKIREEKKSNGNCPKFTHTPVFSGQSAGLANCDLRVANPR